MMDEKEKLGWPLLFEALGEMVIFASVFVGGACAFAALLFPPLLLVTIVMFVFLAGAFGTSEWRQPLPERKNHCRPQETQKDDA